MKKFFTLGLVITFLFLSACGSLSRSSPVTSYTNSFTTTQTSISTTKAITETYILNINSHKIHDPNCCAIKQMKEENKQEYTGALYILFEDGYTTCGLCF